MGKPFMAELQQLQETYSVALSLDSSPLEVALSKAARSPMVAVGSGGSLSAAHFACYLHEHSTGELATSRTPLEVLSLLADPVARRSVVSSMVLCLSAGGSNADINRSFRALIHGEPRHLLALCARRGSPLSRMASKYDYVSLLDFDLPSGRDGFLATNSLLAFVVLLSRSYGQLLGSSPALPPTLWELVGKYHDLESALGDFRRRLRPCLERDHLVVLHGVRTEAAACDIESKFTEAALGSVQLSDYRNFAHGRHNWLAKRSEMSAVVALAEDGDITLAERTVSLLPSSLPSAILRIPGDSISSSIGAVVAGFLITALAGGIRGVDPGRPAVPRFGRRLYHLGVGLIGRDKRKEQVPVQRKAGACISSSSELTKAYATFARSLNRTAFSGLVLDYDGTLCGIDRRFEPLDREVVKELLRLLKASIPVGIATGRGKSVGKSLREALPKTVWGQVTVGYYNGAECACLSNDSAPDRTSRVQPELEAAARVLSSDSSLKSFADITFRRKQISLEPTHVRHLDALWELVGGHISRLGGTRIRMVTSAHSIDVLAPGVSKCNVVDAVRECCSDTEHSPVLCIGDQGKWPGNDSDLLSQPHALSVDTVSSDLSTCWSIAPAGYRGPQAAMFYLRSLVAQDGQFRLRVGRVGGTRR